MSAARLGTVTRRALIAAVGLVLLTGQAAYGQAWITQGPYEPKPMEPEYSDKNNKLKYDNPNVDVRYLNDQERPRLKVDFRIDADGTLRAYTAFDGKPLDTSDIGTEQGLYVMDAEGNIYFAKETWINGRVQHSTIAAGQPVAAAGHLKAVNGVITYIDNNSGHYKPENLHLIQAIESLAAKGVKKGSYKVKSSSPVPLPPSALGREAIVRIMGRNANETATLAELIDKAGAEAEGKGLNPDPEGGPNRVKEHLIPIVINPETADIGIADHSGEAARETRLTNADIAAAIGTTLPEAITGYIRVKKFYDAGGKPVGSELIFDFVTAPRDLSVVVYDNAFWVNMLRNLANHPEGRLLNGALLVYQGHRELKGSWWRFQAGNSVLEPSRPGEPPPAPRDPNARYFSGPGGSENPPLDDSVAERKRAEGNVGMDTEAPDNPSTPPEPELTEQGPSNPDVENKVRALLDSYPVSQLKQDLQKKDSKFFQNELFRSGDAKERTRAFKRVLTERKYSLSGHSGAMADLRRELILSTWEKVARDHGVPIELIDSGKTNGFLSDIDLTVYVPPEARGNLTVATLIKYFNEEFKRTAQGEVDNLDVTIHDGDLFIPDPRLSTQSFEEYAQSLNDVLKRLREEANTKDVYKDTDANRLQVQRRALREGKVTKLTPQANGKDVKRTEAKVAELSWRPGGGWDINSSRFEGTQPSFDRSDIFGNLLENLDHMSQKGDSAGDFAKAFMRAVNQGVGAGQVNSYSDIHSAPLPERGNAPGALAAERDAGVDVSEELVRLALNLESGNPVDRATEKLGRVNIGGSETAPTRTMMKLRWIIRAFGLARPAGSYYAGNSKNLRIVMPAKSTFTQGEVLNVRSLFRLINVAADMEAMKNAGQPILDNKDPNRGRSSWLKPYFDEAEKEVRRQPGSDKLNDKAMADAIYAEAWRYYTNDLKDVVVKEMATSIKRLFYDLTLEGVRRNAMYFAQPDGTLDLLAARKFAQQRREQLAQLLETIEAMDRRGMLKPGATPEQVAKAEQSRVVADSLRANVKSKLAAVKDGELQGQIEMMMDLSGAELGNFLKDLSPSDRDIEKILGAEEARIRAINEPVDPSRDAEFAEWMRLDIIRHNNPADGPSLIKALDAMNSTLGEMLDTKVDTKVVIDTVKQAAKGPTEGEKPPMQPTEEGYKPATTEGVGSHYPGLAMMGNSVVNIATAYSGGDPIAFREAVIGEAFNVFLPPAYGVIATGMKDFGRGKFAEGLVSIGYLAGFHIAESVVPGVGQAVMAFQLARGLPKLAYIVATQQMDQDLLELAFQSIPSANPDGGLALRRAERNPYRFELFAFPKKAGSDAAGKAAVNQQPTRKAESGLSIPGTDMMRAANRTDAPLRPILWGFNSCADPALAGWPASSRVSLTDPVDQMTMAEKLPLARQMFGAQIKRELDSAGLAPEDTAGNAIREGYAEWAKQQLEKSYAFDLPFNLRVSKLYDCFFPLLVQKRKEVPSRQSAADDTQQALGGVGFVRPPGEFDDDQLLEEIFTQVVDNWFNQQPDPYKEQFEYESPFQRLLPWHDPVQHSVRMRKALVLKLVALYKQSEEAANTKIDQEQEVLTITAKNAKRAEDVARRGYGMRTSLTNRTAQRMEKVIANNYVSIKEMEPKAWLSIPPNYVPLTSQLGELTSPPIIANVRADATRHPKPWNALMSVTVDSCSADWQKALPGLRLSAAEQKRLDAKSTNANALLGNFHDRLLAVNFMASADIVDASGAKFASIDKTLVRGYIFDTVADFSASVKVIATGNGPGGAVKLTPATLKVNGQPRTFKDGSFTVNAPGSYQIEATFGGGDWGNATTTVNVAPPQEDKALCTNNPKVIEVQASLTPPYLKKDPGADPNPPGAKPDAPKPPAAKTPPAGKDSGKKNGTTDGGDTNTNTTNTGNTTTKTQPPAGPDPKLVAACEQAIAGVREKGTADPSEISRIQQQCVGVSPGIDQGVQGLTGDLTNAVNASIAACNYQQALALAQAGRAAIQGNPAGAAWLNANLAGLQSRAKAEVDARAFLQQGQAAIQRGDVKAAVAALDQALKVPNLPQCLADQITALRGPLDARQKFIDDAASLVGAYDRCDVNQVLTLRGQMDSLQPRDQMMTNWLAQNPSATLADWARRYLEAYSLVEQAQALSKTAVSTADWDGVISLLERARNTSLGCINALAIDKRLDDARRRRPAPPTAPPVTVVQPPPPPPSQPGSGTWRLVSVDAQPRQRTGWQYNTQTPGARFTRDNGDRGQFDWTAPPAQLNVNGFTVDLRVQANPTGNSPIAMQLCAGGTQAALLSDNSCAQLGTGNSAGVPLPGFGVTGTKTVKFTPDLRSGTTVDFRISANAGGEVVFTYKYQLVP